MSLIQNFRYRGFISVLGWDSKQTSQSLKTVQLRLDFIQLFNSEDGNDGDDGNGGDGCWTPQKLGFLDC